MMSMHCLRYLRMIYRMRATGIAEWIKEKNEKGKKKVNK